MKTDNHENHYSLSSQQHEGTEPKHHRSRANGDIKEEDTRNYDDLNHMHKNQHLAAPEVFIEDMTDIESGSKSKLNDNNGGQVHDRNCVGQTVLKINNITQNDMQTGNSSPSTRETRDAENKCSWFLKKLILFSASHVGLTCIVVGYSIVGAFLFEYLEAPNEEKSRRVVSFMRNKRRQEIWNITKQFNVLHEGNWSKKASDILINFQKDIFNITKELGWDGITDVAEGDLYWSFTGALLYSVTVITTIGYGNITPKTTEGRIATMIYALLGIPLTLLCLANIGKTLGKAFRVLYRKVASLLFDRNTKNQIPAQTKMTVTYSNGETGQEIQDHLPTVCTNDMNKNDNSKQYVNLTQVMIELSKNNQRKKREVPLVLCLVIVVVYNLLGSLIFGLWEKDWDFLTGIYFCFITLSTIGFGDVVPGHSLESWQSHEKKVICTLYLLVGLALIAMCFDLMQTQVRTLARTFGQKLGLMERANPNESEQNIPEDL